MKKKKLVKLLFFSGLLLIISPHILVQINNYIQSKEVAVFQTEISEADTEEMDEELSQLKACYGNTYYDEEGIHDPFEESNAKLEEFIDCIGADDDEVFAAIEIPKLKLSIPIYLGSTEKQLSKGIGQVEGSSLPLGGEGTHTILSGHRGMGTKAMFRNVDELDPGDIFYIHGRTGTLKYEVAKQRVINPNEISSFDALAVEDGKDQATLFTCHPYRHNYQRLLIHAERVD